MTERTRVFQFLRTLALVHRRRARTTNAKRVDIAMDVAACNALTLAAAYVQQGTHDHPMFDAEATIDDLPPELLEDLLR